MDNLIKKVMEENGIFAMLFLATLYFFWKYINSNHQEIIGANTRLGTRLNDVEKYVKDSLMEILVETRTVLSHSTKINEMALRELQAHLPKCQHDGNYEMTDSQVVLSKDLKGVITDTQMMRKVNKQ